MLPLDLIMVGVLIISILLGFPVSFTIAGVATLFAVLGAMTGAMDLSLLGALGQRVFGVMTNNVLIAIPFVRIDGVWCWKKAELLKIFWRLWVSCLVEFVAVLVFRWWWLVPCWLLRQALSVLPLSQWV